MKRGSIAFLAWGALAASGAAADGRLLIVRLAPGASAFVVGARYQCRLLDFTPGAPFVLYRALSSQHADAVQRRMARDTQVIWSEDDVEIRAPENQGAPGTKPTKGGSVPAVGDRAQLVQTNSQFLAQINWTSSIADEAGRTVRVAILDTGLAPTQTALWSKVVASANMVEPGLPAHDVPRNQDSNRNGVLDQSVGHGTMVAGLIDLVSPKSRFVIARVADSDGNASAWSLIKGLAYAVTSGAEVVNVSLGSLTKIPALNDTIEWCEQNRMLLVGAIGNESVRDAADPAGISGVICVAGLNADSTKASFSNWHRKSIACAPAVGLASQYWDGDLVAWSGTSFSAPLVTGALVEYVRRSSGRMSPLAVRNALISSVNNVDGINADYRGELGGRLNVARLMATRGRP